MLGSFRDPAGFVFERQGRILRAIRGSFAQSYDHAVRSGFHAEAMREGLLIPHREVDASGLELGDDLHRLLEPERLAFVSYPYEWCFGQLRDAALLTLRLARMALRFGLMLKDASAYNVQFRGSVPVFIDTPSFVLAEPGQLWPAYYQFCRHFLAPLALASHTRGAFGRELRVHLEGVPLELASRQLPLRTWLRPGLTTHLHLHAVSERRQSSAARPERSAPNRVREHAVPALLDHLEGVVSGLRSPDVETEWSDYERSTHYSSASLAHKSELVAEVLAELAPASVWDLGANTGRYSRLASERGITTVALDGDSGAVERSYVAARTRGDRHLLPLWMDLCNPSPRLGWECEERMSLLDRGPCDVGLALALVHHLVLGRGIPMERVASGLRQIARNLLIEWVPASDEMAAPLAARRPEGAPLYTEAHLEASFRKEFDACRRWNLRDSQRVLHLFRAKV